MLDQYRQSLRNAEAAVVAGTETVRVPLLRGLRRRLRDQPFHMIPEVFFQQCGSTRFTMPEEEFVLRPGQACIMPRGVPHRERSIGAVGDYLTLIMMFCDNGFSLHYGRSSANRSVHSDPARRFITPKEGRLLSYIDDLVMARDAGLSSSDGYVRGLWRATLALVQHEMHAGTTPPVHRHPLVARSLDLIQVHLGDLKLKVEWLSERLACTPDHLSRVFRRETGQRLMDLILVRRIAQAEHLLIQGELTIGEVAWTCGFATQSYFNRVFRARRRMTPREFQRRKVS